MADIAIWNFHESMEGYNYALDFVKVEYMPNCSAVFIFEDGYRLNEAKHRYFFRFTEIRSMRISMSGPLNIEPFSHWVSQGKMDIPCSAIYKLTNCEFIDWLIENESSGEYHSDPAGLINYLFTRINLANPADSTEAYLRTSTTRTRAAP